MRDRVMGGIQCGIVSWGGPAVRDRVMGGSSRAGSNRPEFRVGPEREGRGRVGDVMHREAGGRSDGDPGWGSYMRILDGDPICRSWMGILDGDPICGSWMCNRMGVGWRGCRRTC